MSGSVRPSLDSVTTINADGSRPFLHPADTRGRWTLMRRLAAWILIGVYVGLPWVPVGGYPAVFLDVRHSRFHLFGGTLAIQDAWLLFFLITGVGFGLIFITALLGRIWCGWACPQTVFLDHVYRRIERWIDGDPIARRKLDAAPWTSAKVVRRVVKHALYVLVAAAIMHLFLAYFVSLPEVYRMMTHAPTDHWAAFVFMMVATGILYFNFAWFREQLCIVICPYGRLQSALIDDHSMVIGYDARRGEPRKGQAAGTHGDCVDCLRCVHVCPTGIDIRQGLQMECIGCTACIDACDEVMVKLKRPRGLIRYDSLAGFAGRATRWIRPRTIIYTVLLLVGASVASIAISGVRPATFLPMRMPGGAYVIDPDGVRNQYLVRLVNKTDVPRMLRLTARGLPTGALTAGIDEPIQVQPMAEVMQTVILRVPRQHYTGTFRFELGMKDETSGYELARSLDFVGPSPKLLDDDFWREKSAGR